MDERELRRLNAGETFAGCEALWRDGAREALEGLYNALRPNPNERIVVLDDDPTGVQTVHDIEVVTRWDEATLRDMLGGDGRMFFVLTNSRSFSAAKTRAVHRQIAENALRAAAATGRQLTIISRGDSTLRGHYPLETRALKEVLSEKPPLDGEILCPFFAEGGRFTLNGVHYVRQGEWLTPAAQTEFAKDATFGYRHSFLPDYIEEKSEGTVSSGSVEVVRLEQLRRLRFDEIEARLLASERYTYVVSDALEKADVQALAILLHRLEKRGKRYLLRSAAAVPKVLGHVSDRALLGRGELAGAENGRGGLVLVGSHVKKTTDQLDCLRQSAAPLEFIEFDVSAWQSPEGLERQTRRVAKATGSAIERGITAVVYTSRTLVAPEDADAETRLAISVRISDAVTAVVALLPVRPRFLIAKGGITSSDVGVKALGVVRALVTGQAAPGVPVWRTGPESRFPGLSYIIFPGNVGDVDTLRVIVEKLV